MGRPKKEMAVIKIPKGINNMDCQTNGVHPIVMVNALRILEKHFARELVKMAEEAVGKNPAAQDAYFNKLTEKHLGENPSPGESFWTPKNLN